LRDPAGSRFEIHQGWGLSHQRGRRAGGRIRGKRVGKVWAKRDENFTEEQQNQAEQRDRNGGRNAKVGRLAEPAIRRFMAARMGVRHDMQQKENGNQGQRKGGTRGQPAILPGIR